jgi:hypothetical protein
MSEQLLTADELARWLSVERDYVYAHADELGALRLGSGPRARLRFDRDEVRRRLSSCSASRQSHEGETAAQTPKPRRRRRAGMGTSIDLLPIRGRSEAA